MSETAELLENPLAALSSLEVSAALTDFVRQELRRYRLATLEDGKAVSVSVLSGRIQVVDERLDFSPETLRRFLNGEKQKTSPDIIRAIAGFLVEEEWLTPADLKARGEKTDYRAAFALGAFFGISSNDRTLEFYRELAGPYRQYIFATDRLMKINCQIGVDEQAGLLSMTETTQWYELLPESSLVEKFIQRPEITASEYSMLDSKMDSEAQPVGTPLLASGFGVSDHRVLAFFLTDRRTDQPKLYDIFTVMYDKKDDLAGLVGHSNAGWNAWSAFGAQMRDGKKLLDPETLRNPESQRYLVRQQ